MWPAPLTLDEAREMIRRIRGYRILTAFRGRPAADLEAVAQVLCDVGQLAYQWQERIAELEINPLFVLPRGFRRDRGRRTGGLAVVFLLADGKFCSRRSSRDTREHDRRDSGPVARHEAQPLNF